MKVPIRVPFANELVRPIHRPGRLLPFALTMLLCFVSSPTLGQDEVDVFGSERLHCSELRQLGELRDSFDCLEALWTEHGAEMTPTGRVEVLRQMGELYSVAGSPTEAKACYSAILGIDPHWLPENFDALPTSWREPILAAYRGRGYLARSTGMHNIALLDFEVVDLSKDEVDLGAISQALPSYISSYLQESLNGATVRGGETPIKLVSYRERELLMGELARAQGLTPGMPVTADILQGEVLVQAGRLQAVQGFLSGTIIRDTSGKVNIAMRLISVETGELTCPVTKQGKAKKLFELLEDSLEDWRDCAVEGGSEQKDRGTETLGDMAQGVKALEYYHTSLALLEEENFGEALVQARAASDLRPHDIEFIQLIEVLEAQAETVELVQRTELPSLEFGQP